MSDKINLESRVPLKRVGHHQELANLAAYLMSDFSSYVNGEVITIDGGEWLQGAGQFNQMEAITPEEWDLLEKVVRGNQKKS
jgi:enoyl-[acyl-carrier-protein] reductase (NADH)